MASIELRAFRDADEQAVVALWQTCGLTRPWNDPHKDIDRKRRVQPQLFLVAEQGQRVIASVMAGYDGHRGWVNYLAVHPDVRRHGLGSRLMSEVEARLMTMGCPKLNLQVRADKAEVAAFYQSLGYAQDAVVSLGKRLIPDEPAG